MILLLAAGYLVVTMVVGELVIAGAGWSTSPVARGSRPAIGMAAMGLQLWAYRALHIPWHQVTLLAPWVLLGMTRAGRLWDAASGIAGACLRNVRTPTSLAGGALLLFFLVPELLGVTLRPVVGYDGVAIWMMRARMFARLDSDALGTALGATPHHDYPPLFSLMVDSVWLVTGSATDMVGKTVNVPLLISLVAAMLLWFGGGRLRAPALAAVVALVSLPSLDRWLYSGYYLGYADFAVATFIGIGGLALFCWLREGRSADLGLALSFALLAALTKNEGMPFAVATVVIVVVAGAPRLRMVAPRPLIPVAFALVAVVAWRILVAAQGYGNEFVAQGGPHDLGQVAARAATVLTFAFHLLDPLRTDYPWILLAFVAAAELTIVRRDRVSAALLVLVALQGLAYFAIYVLVPGSVDYYLNTSADRLTVQVLPLVLIALLGALAGTEPRAPIYLGASSGQVPVRQTRTTRPGASEE